MALTIHDVEQGTDEWLELRRGIVTASTVGRLITTRTIQPAENNTSRELERVLLAERITDRTVPSFYTPDMMRGTLEEPIARDLYSRHYAPVEQTGIMIEDRWGYQIGYSPDGLVGDDGLIEIKSRKPVKHIRTIFEDAVPSENMAQLQCGLLVSGREWIDYVSYCNGMPLYVQRVFPEARWQETIIAAAGNLEDAINHDRWIYDEVTKGMPQTEFIDHDEEIRI